MGVAMAVTDRSARGRAGAGTASWIVAVLLGIAFPGTSPAQSDLPNLRPFQPDGWSDAIVVSNIQDTNTDTLELNATDKLYVDFAVINSATASTTTPFRIELFLNGRSWEVFEVLSPLDSQVYRFREDYPVRRLGIGAHTLRIVADAGEAVSESDESDNEYTRTIIVTGDCVPLTTKVSPREAGILLPNRDPTCGGSTVSTSSLMVHDESPRLPPGKLDIGGAPIEEARRAKALAALRSRVQSEGRVRVIVGLRTRGLPVAAAAAGSGQAETRAGPIAQAQQALEVRMSSHEVTSIRRFRYIPYVAMEVDEAALEALASDPEVVSIEANGVVKPLLAESTALIGAPHAWEQGYDGSGQVIAILDTGVDKDHPFLEGKVVSEACYSGGGDAESSVCPGGVTESTGPGSAAPCSASDCFHGTAMAGVAAGRGTDFSGVAPGAQIIAIQTATLCGGDCVELHDSDWIAGLERVFDLSASFDIAAVNMSFGGRIFSEECDGEHPAAKAALDRVRAAGIAPIASSGNDGSETGINNPACISTAISVGSTGDGSSITSPDAVSNFSNSSPFLDLLAPGASITTSTLDNEFSSYDGTSLSAPHVAGAWAVMKSKAPNASVGEILTILNNTGIPIADPKNDVIKPRIQVDAALDAVIPEHSYSSGTLLSLTPHPNPGFRFKHWRGCESSPGNRCVVEIDQSSDITAFFEPMADSYPDLVTSSLTGPSTATIGSTASVSADIRNQGPANAGPFRLGLYLSADATITTEDTWFAACSYEEGLLAGESETCSRSFPIPPRVRPGRYTLGAIVDDLDRVAEKSETNNSRVAESGPMDVLAPRILSRSFVPVILSAEGRRGSFFTSELTLTNRGSTTAAIHYDYTASFGGGSGTAVDFLEPGRQRVIPDAIAYLKSLGVPIGEGSAGGTLAVHAFNLSAASDAAATVRVTTPVEEGSARAGLAFPGVRPEGLLSGPAFIAGLRQNSRDRSNLAVQNAGDPGQGSLTLRVTVFSGDPAAPGRSEVLPDRTLPPGGFHQYNGILEVAGFDNGYVKVERIEGTAPYYAYGVINDQANSDGSFVFPVRAASLAGKRGQTLPVIIETRDFTSELAVTNFSRVAKTVDFRLVADAVETADDTARFSLRLQAGEQRILPGIIDWMRRRGVAGIGGADRALAGALFARVESGDMSGIVIGARTGSSDGRGGQYGLFYNGVPNGAASVETAWIYGLQQNEENRSNLALVNTGEVDDGDSVFGIDLYDGDTSLLVRTITTQPLPARRWRQINAILADHAPGTTQGYVRIRQTSGNNPFLAYGVVNDGGAPGQRSGDGAYVPARK